jgi:uncharacterized membrane protein YdbT with pleckstrin-like domain
MSEDQNERVYEFRPHWIMLVRPTLIALAGIAVYKFGRDFFSSREGVLFANGLFGTLGPLLGPQGVETLERLAQPLVILLLILVFGLPLLRAFILRATTSLGVDSRQIIWRRGIFLRDITQVEIGEIVGVNVAQSLLGRLLGFGTVDIETRGEDRLVMPMMDKARGFAGLVLDFKHRFAARQ